MFWKGKADAANETAANEARQVSVASQPLGKAVLPHVEGDIRSPHGGHTLVRVHGKRLVTAAEIPPRSEPEEAVA